MRKKMKCSNNRTRYKEIFTDMNGDQFIIERATSDIQQHYLNRARSGVHYYNGLGCSLKTPEVTDFQHQNELWLKTQFIKGAKWERSTEKAMSYLREISEKGTLIILSKQAIDEILENFVSSFPLKIRDEIIKTVEYSNFEAELLSNIGNEINLVYEHGDFTINNLLRFKARNFLIDFEFYRLSQPEGFDLLDFHKSLGKPPGLIPNIEINLKKYELVERANALVDEYRERIRIRDIDWQKWKKLYLTHGVDYAQNPEWIKIWAKSFLTADQVLEPFIDRENENSVSVHPLVKSRSETYPAGLYPDYIDQFVPLTSTNQSARNLLNHVKKTGDILDLKYVSTENFFISDLIRRADADPETTIFIEYIDVRPKVLLENYTHTKKVKSDIKRLLNRSKLYDNRGFQFSIKSGVKLEDISEILNLHEKRWGRRVYEDRTAMENFIFDLWKENLLIIAELKLSDQSVAFQVCHVANLKITSWLPVYSLEYKELSPGKYIQHELINWCIDQGFKIFDFGRGIENYKYTYANSSEVLYNIKIKRTGRLNKKFLIFVKKVYLKFISTFLKLGVEQ